MEMTKMKSLLEINEAKKFIFLSIATGMLILAGLSLPVTAACIGCMGLPTDPACCFAGSSSSGGSSSSSSSGGMGDVTTGSKTHVQGFEPGGKFYIGDGFTAWISGDQKTVITFNLLDGYKVEQITAIEVIQPGSDANSGPPGPDMLFNPLDSLDLSNDMGMNTPVRQDLFNLPDSFSTGSDTGLSGGSDLSPSGTDDSDSNDNAANLFPLSPSGLWTVRDANEGTADTNIPSTTGTDDSDSNDNAANLFPLSPSGLWTVRDANEGTADTNIPSTTGTDDSDSNDNAANLFPLSPSGLWTVRDANEGTADTNIPSTTGTDDYNGFFFINPNAGGYDGFKIPGNLIDEFNSMLVTFDPSKKVDVNENKVEIMTSTDSDGNKIITETRIDLYGNKETTTTKFTPDGVKIESREVRYDETGNRIVLVTEYDSEGNVKKETQTDSAGQLEKTYIYGPGMSDSVVETRIDAYGNKIVSTSYATGIDSEVIDSVTYDPNGEKVGVARTIVDDKGNKVTIEIKTNAQGHVVTSQTKTDPSGNKVIVEERIENGVPRGYTEMKIDFAGKREVRLLDFNGNEVSPGTNKGEGTTSTSKVTQSDRLSWVNSDIKLELIKRFYGPETLGIEE